MTAVAARKGWISRLCSGEGRLEVVATDGFNEAESDSSAVDELGIDSQPNSRPFAAASVKSLLESSGRRVQVTDELRSRLCVPITGTNGGSIGELTVCLGPRRRGGKQEREVLRLHARMAADLIELQERTDTLRESEACYRQLVERAAAGVFLSDHAGRIVVANQLVCDVLGCTPAQWMEMDWRQFLRKSDGSPVWHGLPVEQPQRIECRLRQPGGSCFEADIALMPFANGLTEVVVRDITARKRPENIVLGQNRALHLLAADEPLERVLAELVEVVERESGGQVISSILLLDSQGKLRHGAAPSLPDDYNRAIDGLPIARDVGTCCAAAARNEVICTRDIEHATGWRSFKHLPLGLGLRAAWSMPIRGSDGKVLGTFGTYFRECREPKESERELVELMVKTAAIAIERRRAEAALRATQLTLRDSETFLQGVVNSSADCFKVLDVEGRLQWMSEGGQRMLDITDFAQIAGTPLPGFYQGAARLDAERAIKTARTGGVGRFRGYCPTYRGVPKWWDVVISPIPGEEGRPQMLLSVSRDITALHSAEEALRVSQEELRQHAESLERRVVERTARLQDTISELESFSYSISHDMRAPLRAMQSFARFLQAECGENLGAQGKDYIRRIVNAADRMDRLIQDVLVYSRLSQADIVLEPVDLHALLTGILESYPQFDLSVADVSIVGAVPLVRGSSAALSQCFSNLLDNAIKFIAPGTRPEIRIWAEEANGRVRVYVKDNGVGIPRAQWDKIFGIFYRIDQTKAGTGIGLSIVKKAIERIGGTVGVTSEVGRGSTFYVDVAGVRQ